MKYLYGDATESPLDRNYIEYLKAVLEFAVSVLTSVDRVRELNQTGKQRQKFAAKELKQLDFVAKRLANALDDCAGIETVPVTDKVLEALRALALGEVRKAEAHVRGSLEGELRKIDAAVRQHRGDNLKRLEKLLLKHDLPESRQWVDVKMGDDGMYAATLRGMSTSDVSWNILLDIPADHLLGQPLRIDRLYPDMALKVPEMSGWISKSVKLRTHKLGREFVTDLAHHKGRALMRLRSNIGDKDNGFDIAFNAMGIPSSIARKVKGEATEPFEPQPDDADVLRELFNKVASAGSELVNRRQALKSAKLDNKPIEEHTAPAVLVERLVAQMAPFVREISAHSLSPTELVLKRVLADDRREELFASKKDLRDMLAPLSPDAMQLFRPLDIGIKARSKAPAAVASESIAPSESLPPVGITRSQPAPSMPATPSAPPVSFPPAPAFPSPPAIEAPPAVEPAPPQRSEPPADPPRMFPPPEKSFSPPDRDLPPLVPTPPPLGSPPPPPLRSAPSSDRLRGPPSGEGLAAPSGPGGPHGPPPMGGLPPRPKPAKRRSRRDNPVIQTSPGLAPDADDIPNIEVSDAPPPAHVPGDGSFDLTGPPPPSATFPREPPSATFPRDLPSKRPPRAVPASPSSPHATSSTPGAPPSSPHGHDPGAVPSSPEPGSPPPVGPVGHVITPVGPPFVGQGLPPAAGMGPMPVPTVDVASRSEVDDEPMTRQRHVDPVFAPPLMPVFSDDEERTAAIPIDQLQRQLAADRSESHDDDLPQPPGDASASGPGIPMPSRPPRRRNPVRPSPSRNTIQGPPPMPPAPKPRSKLDSIDVDIDGD